MGKLIKRSRPADENMPPGEHPNGDKGDRAFKVGDTAIPVEEEPAEPHWACCWQGDDFIEGIQCGSYEKAVDQIISFVERGGSEDRFGYAIPLYLIDLVKAAVGRHPCLNTTPEEGRDIFRTRIRPHLWS